MLDTAIVGGGLCGLALAKALHQKSHTFAVFEARRRLGGRILSLRTKDGKGRVDLGPTWFWPQSQPLITELVREFGLRTFSQHDSGTVLALTDPDKAAEPACSGGVHGGARRLAQGMASLVEALARRLPADRLHLDHVLGAVLRHDDHVELHFVHGDEIVVVQARRVVLAIPPRLLAEQVRFEPELDERLRASMVAAPTWMAAQAKAVLRYERAAWRAKGQSGSAFVQHERALFRETFDACDESGKLAALGGFFALSPAVRNAFQAGMPLLMSSQMSQLFGAQMQEREQVCQDWANELHTCSDQDLSDFDLATAHPEYGDRVLRRPVWQGRLHFGASETAGYGGGYLEGALDAARRIQRELASLDSAHAPAASSPLVEAREQNAAAPPQGERVPPGAHPWGEQGAW